MILTFKILQQHEAIKIDNFGEINIFLKNHNSLNQNEEIKYVSIIIYFAKYFSILKIS